MKQILTMGTLAFAWACCPAEGHAAEASNEVEQLRQQLQAVIERLDKLERENASLRAERDSDKARTADLSAYLKAEARGLRKDSAQQAAEVGKLKGADWASRVAVKGDLRYRREEIQDDTVSSSGVATANRSRDRIRARLGVEAKATEDIAVGLGITTAENNDPRSGNQSLTGVEAKKSFDLDYAYFDWKFALWGDLIGGKMKQPFFKPGQSLFWDGDITPEGLALNLNEGMWFGTLFGYWINEYSGSATGRTSDTMLYGGQVGTRLAVGEATLVLTGQYSDLAAGQGRSPFYNGSANGNSTLTVNNSPVLVNDYRVMGISAELNRLVGIRPLQFWVDFARNQAANDLNTAWAAGVLFGKASDYHTWELGLAYESHEKDALFGQLVDSDFGAGNTDAAGWVLRAGYAPVKNWLLSATYMLNQRNVDVANSAGDTGVDYDRLQLDFSMKF